LILCRVRQRPFVLEHLAKIAAIDPAIAGRASDEVHSARQIYLGKRLGDRPSSDAEHALLTALFREALINAKMRWFAA
jgi:hypothetical protein